MALVLNTSLHVSLLLTLNAIKLHERPFQSVAARGFLPPGANVCVAAPLVRDGVWGGGVPFPIGGGVTAPSPKFFGYFNVEIPYFPGILVLTVKSQRATFGILGGMAGGPLAPPPKSAYVEDYITPGNSIVLNYILYFCKR